MYAPLQKQYINKLIRTNQADATIELVRILFGVYDIEYAIAHIIHESSKVIALGIAALRFNLHTDIHV